MYPGHPLAKHAMVRSGLCPLGLHPPAHPSPAKTQSHRSTPGWAEELAWDAGLPCPGAAGGSWGAGCQEGGLSVPTRHWESHQSELCGFRGSSGLRCPVPPAWYRGGGH